MVAAVTIRVDPVAGNDANDGQTGAVRTLPRARTLARAALVGATGLVLVACGAGRYTDPLVIDTAADGGGAGVVWHFDDDAVLSSAVRATGWQVEPSTGLWWAPAPAGRKIRTVWAGKYMCKRAPYRTADGQPMRVSVWDDTLRTLTIPSAPFAGLTPAEMNSLELTVHMGWNLSILRIDTVLVSGVNAVIAPKAIERIMEFTKGIVSTTPPNPTQVPNMEFGYGPYHAPGQAVFLDGAKAWCKEPGDFWHDTVNNRVYVYPVPEGLSWWEARAWLPGEADTMIYHRNAKKVRIIAPRIERLAWDDPAEFGFVGYNGGIALKLTERVSTPGVYDFAYQRIPAGIDFEDAEDFQLVRPKLRQIGGVGIRGGKGLNRISIKDPRFFRIWSSNLYINSEHVFVTRSSPVSEWTRDVRIEGLVGRYAGEVYSGDGLFVGSCSKLRIRDVNLDWCSSSGLNLGWGGKIEATRPQEDAIIEDIKIRRACAVQIDDGAIYCNGLWGSVVTSVPTAPRPDGILFRRIDIADIVPSGYDRITGHAVGFYLDLGCDGAWVQNLKVHRVDRGLQENCCHFSVFDAVDLDRCTVDWNVSYSGYNHDPDGAGPTISYRGPTAVNDNQAWDGGGGWAPLKDRLPGLTLPQLFRAGFTTSTVGNNFSAGWASTSRMTRVGGASVAPVMVTPIDVLDALELAA